MIYSFPPIEPPDATILILGTMPSVRSLQHGQYYGHPQNQFWNILFSLWELPTPIEYEKRVAFLQEKNIALWDVLRCCNRDGSMDANIKNPQPNDIPSLLTRNPKIHTIFFNSKNAQKLFHQLIHNLPNRPLSFIPLPSTSPARAMKFDEKLKQWSVVKAACGEMSI